MITLRLKIFYCYIMLVLCAHLVQSAPMHRLRLGKGNKDSRYRDSQDDSSSSSHHQHHQYHNEANDSQYDTSSDGSRISTPGSSYDTDRFYEDIHNAALETRHDTSTNPPSHHNGWSRTHPGFDAQMEIQRKIQQLQLQEQEHDQNSDSSSSSPSSPPRILDPETAAIQAERYKRLRSYRSRSNFLFASASERHRRE